MRKLVIALAFTSVAFAASTVYFAHELSLERDRASARMRPPPAGPARGSWPEAAPAPVTVAAAQEPGAAKTATAGSATTGFGSNVVIAGQPVSDADIKQMQAEYSRNLLAQLADPVRSEEMLAEHKMMMRMSYPRVDQVLGLSPDEYARFIELTARQQLDVQEASARCMVDPACQMQDLYRVASEPRQREINELLGDERARGLETYKNTLGEREAVSQLRNRLPDASRLSDANAELLISALAEERELIHREAAQRGSDVNSLSVGVGLVFAPGDGATYEERYEAARQSSQRMRDRASQFLSAEQMRAFNEMQDETLISLRGALRNRSGMTESAVAITAPVH